MNRKLLQISIVIMATSSIRSGFADEATNPDDLDEALATTEISQVEFPSGRFAIDPAIEERHSLRFGISNLRMIDGNGYYEESRFGKPSGVFSLSWFPIRQVGLGYNWESNFRSAELQYVPVISPKLRFHFGALMGLTKDSKRKWTDGTSHFGVHGVFFLNTHLGITAVFRRTVFATERVDLTRYGMGLQVRI